MGACVLSQMPQNSLIVVSNKLWKPNKDLKKQTGVNNGKQFVGDHGEQ